MNEYVKALFHCHTTYSDDGTLTCAELAQMGQAKGFDYIFLSDHFEHIDNQSYNQLIADCEQCNKKFSCKLVPGYEKSWEGYHICAYNLKTWMNSSHFDEWAEKVKQQGGTVVSVHPGKYNFKIPSKLLDKCDGVEVWNSKWPYDGKLYPNAKALKLVGNRAKYCGQDLHKKTDFNSLAMCLKREDAQTPEDVLMAIQSGKGTIKGNVFTFSEKRSKRLFLPLSGYHWARLKAYFSAYQLKKMIFG